MRSIRLLALTALALSSCEPLGAVQLSINGYTSPDQPNPDLEVVDVATQHNRVQNNGEPAYKFINTAHVVILSDDEKTTYLDKTYFLPGKATGFPMFFGIDEGVKDISRITIDFKFLWSENGTDTVIAAAKAKASFVPQSDPTSITLKVYGSN